jgi:DNA-directed RNA polymerase subunit alpha
MFIKTNGTIAPREALERSIETMIHQLKAVIGFQEGEPEKEEPVKAYALTDATDLAKVKVAELGLSARVASALDEAGIKSAAGLARKTPSALKEMDGIGDKAVEEISTALAGLGLTLKRD